MDILTVGFITAIILLTISKLLFNLYIYKNSIYEVIYSGFTEYRVRKRSIEGMSESYILTKEFGTNRIVYYMIEKRYFKQSVFVVIILTSGCYVIVVEESQKEGAGCEIKANNKQSIICDLKNISHNLLSFPIITITVLSDTNEIKNKDNKNEITIRKKYLFRTLKKLHDKSKIVLTEENINSIFMTLTHDIIKDYK